MILRAFTSVAATAALLVSLVACASQTPVHPLDGLTISCPNETYSVTHPDAYVQHLHFRCDRDGFVRHD